jgi:hypothetical protein
MSTLPFRFYISYYHPLAKPMKENDVHRPQIAPNDAKPHFWTNLSRFFTDGHAYLAGRLTSTVPFSLAESCTPSPFLLMASPRSS